MMEATVKRKPVVATISVALTDPVAPLMGLEMAEDHVDEHDGQRNPETEHPRAIEDDGENRGDDFPCEGY